jgi:hypothetical protein
MKQGRRFLGRHESGSVNRGTSNENSEGMFFPSLFSGDPSALNGRLSPFHLGAFHLHAFPLLSSRAVRQSADGLTSMWSGTKLHRLRKLRQKRGY